MWRGIVNRPYLFLVAQTILLFLIAGWGSRADFTLAFVLYSLCFGICILIWRFSELSLKNILIWSLVMRLVTLPFFPQFSEDYLRFYFDSYLLKMGENPYLIIPAEYLNFISSDTLTAVVDGMNSPNYYTIYPPLSQFFFGIIYRLSDGSIDIFVLLSKIGLIIADLGSIFFVFKISNQLKKSTSATILFAFSPLIILEFAGNLHTEGLAIFFTLAAIYALLRKYNFSSATLLGLGISVKLLPILIFPVVFSYLGLKRGIIYLFYSLLIFTITLTPFLSLEMINHFSSSLDLYFRNFESNAYIYFILRGIINSFIGYNPIQFLGPVLGIISAISILLLSFKFIRDPEKSEIIEKMAIVFTLYFALSTTVHPWYLSWIVLFSIFSGKYRLLIIWSYLGYLSYFFYADQIQMGWWWWVEYITLTTVILISTMKLGRKNFEYYLK